MKPGAYVFGRRLDMNGLASLGVHQFIVLIPENSKQLESLAKELGDGSRGIVVGAYNVDGRLKSELFAQSDYETVQRFAKLGKVRMAGVQVEKVNLDLSMCWASLDLALQRILRTALSYNPREEKKHVTYPKGLTGQLSKSCRNSNSWAQTVIEIAIGKGAVLEDFDGADLCSEKRLDPSYFQPN